jgi:SNF2 family DNA or RNA helicase
VKELERWQAGDATILGVQIQSGGLGIDCTRAAYAFYYSLGFSLGDYEQSLARLRRPGQTRCVRYYHLVAKHTVDEQVYAALRDRRVVVDAVMERLTKREVVT